MQSPQQVVETYIRAKDENRPYLMERAFAVDATLKMIVKSGTISFPPITKGLQSVSDVLVRRFGQTYENVHTFCLGPPPQIEQRSFSCDWLVGMSEKDSGIVRVGCGRYHWWFQPQGPYLAERLTITVDLMQSLGSGCIASVMDWLSQLPYPWCTAEIAARDMPPLDELQPIRRSIAREAA